MNIKFMNTGRGETNIIQTPLYSEPFVGIAVYITIFTKDIYSISGTQVNKTVKIMHALTLVSWVAEKS